MPGLWERSLPGIVKAWGVVIPFPDVRPPDSRYAWLIGAELGSPLKNPRAIVCPGTFSIPTAITDTADKFRQSAEGLGEGILLVFGGIEVSCSIGVPSPVDIIERAYPNLMPGSRLVDSLRAPMGYPDLRSF